MLQLKKYETIIFDLGGVIIDIFPDKVLNKLFEISNGIKSKEQIATEMKSKQLIELHETGSLSDADFLHQLSILTGCDNTDLLTLAWFEMLGQIPSLRIKHIQKIAQTHKVLLLSNTNSIHSERIDSYLTDKFQTSFDKLFHQVFMSQHIGCRKPDVEIYRHVVENANINPAKSIFIDDVLANALAAERVGIKGFHLDLNKHKLEDIISYE